MTATPTLERPGSLSRHRRRRRRGACRARSGVRPSGVDLHRLLRRVRLGRSGIAKLTDNSFFCHLRTGEYILDHGIPRQDVFSYTAPGTQVGRAVVAGRGRSTASLDAAFGRVRHPPARRAGRRVHRRARVPARAAARRATGSSPADLGGGAARHLHGVVGAAAAARGAVLPGAALDGRGARLLRRPPPVVVVPVLMWLWANMHGTFALGFAYLGLHLLGRWVDGAPPVGGAGAHAALRRGRSRSPQCS